MNPLFTDGELQVLEVLWDRGDATAREVEEALGHGRPYQTYLSRLQALEDKGHVTHEREGRANRYHPRISRECAQRAAVQYLIQRMFDGQSGAFVSRLLEMWEPTEEQREEVRRMLRAAP